MTKNRTFKSINYNGRVYNLLTLPNTNFFKFEIINKYGSHIERIYKERTGKNVFGISHFIEHLGFRATKDFDTATLLKLIKNEGTYNASTDYDRINYWFQTTMDRCKLGVQLVCNYALNDLTKIPNDEFEIEKKVVYNEAKRYADDDQTMFWFNSTAALTGYHKEDNVIGIPETIATFTHEDCIAIKDIFLQNTDNVFNITYDSEILTEQEVIDMVEAELSRFKPLAQTKPITKEEYMAVVETPKNIKVKMENESEQAMTYINLDVVTNSITADYANAYFATYAAEVSLNDIIREKNGLTYGIDFGSANMGYKPYTYFGCDVTKGNEELLMSLFKESINKVADIWSDEAYEKYMTSRKLKRTMSLLDQKNYGSWHSTATWYPEIIEALKDELAHDIDGVYEIMEQKFASKEALGEYMEVVRKTVNSDNFGIVTN